MKRWWYDGLEAGTLKHSDVETYKQFLAKLRSYGYTVEFVGKATGCIRISSAVGQVWRIGASWELALFLEGYTLGLDAAEQMRIR